MDVVFLDYQKAFDTVPHTRLNRKLRGYGVTGKVLNWISEFLRERTQQVSVNNHLSSWTKVISGVPQGSVLGPLLFIVYVNELPDFISNKMKMYADDTKLYGPATKQDEVESMQKDINTLTDWSKDWLLKFNIDKCKIMHCGIQNHHAIYYMKQPNGETKQLIETEVEKDLGVHVTKTLKPTLQLLKSSKQGHVSPEATQDDFWTPNHSQLQDSLLCVHQTTLRALHTSSWTLHGPGLQDTGESTEAGDKVGEGPE